MELELQDGNLSATCVHPGGVATNISKSGRINQGMLEATGLSHEEYARNLDKAIQNTTPDTAASAILKAVQKNARSVIVGNDAKFLSFIQRPIGTRYQKLLTAGIKRQRQKAQG